MKTYTKVIQNSDARQFTPLYVESSKNVASKLVLYWSPQHWWPNPTPPPLLIARHRPHHHRLRRGKNNIETDLSITFLLKNDSYMLTKNITLGRWPVKEG